jgi:phospholipase/carboxylesterase
LCRAHLNLPVSALDEEELRAWFDILHEKFSVELLNSKEILVDWPGLDEMSEKVAELIESEAEGNGKQYNRIILGGFGQGAAMALYAGLKFPHKLGGIISYSGYLPVDGTKLYELSAEIKNLPILAIHGRLDSAIPLDFAKKSYETLSKLEKLGGVKLELREDWLGKHDLSTEQMYNVQQWINSKIIKQLPPLDKKLDTTH